MDVPAGGLLVAHGPAGSGRTVLLLALAGRMRLTTGAVRVGRATVPGRGAHRIRQLVGIARADSAVELERRLRVAESIAERRWTDRAVTVRGVVTAAHLLGVRLRGSTLVEDLTPLDALLFATALALAARPAVLVVDNVGRGCPDLQRERAWQALQAVRATGCTVLASATQPPPDPAPGTVLLELPRRSAARLPGPGPAGSACDLVAHP
ncbi:ABC transporter ATP-binding protein [Kitasatospora sp. RB6PN24]|uniref:ATP-binding cassette domain-containing protein n=1 Tax=Kitasatospora humi TaxID=2893891 RepID=UPI001E4BE58E|nr:ATP-binding cassette domain-containing protein [Kitasatospora humi]MCC9309589.1 ABC transporter ATP-binding protein [Kitasatospora humi]